LASINPNFPAWTSWTSGHRLRAGFSPQRVFPRAMYLATSWPPSPWARPEYLDMVDSGRKNIHRYIHTYIHTLTRSF